MIFLFKNLSSGTFMKVHYRKNGLPIKQKQVHNPEWVLEFALAKFLNLNNPFQTKIPTFQNKIGICSGAVLCSSWCLHCISGRGLAEHSLGSAPGSLLLPLLSAGLEGIVAPHGSPVRVWEGKGEGFWWHWGENSGEALKQVEGAEQLSFLFSLVCFNLKKPFSAQEEAG